MNKVCQDIFKAIHEGKWISIEYKNKEEKVTRYWIGIKNVDLKQKVLIVEGLHLSAQYQCELRIYVDAILSSFVIEGSYFEINRQLVDDIRIHPDKYEVLFQHTWNLKILNYLSDCSRLDTTPYKSDYALIERLDQDRITRGFYTLDHQQFQEIVTNFQQKKGGKDKKKIKELALNILSIQTRYGLYVLAYRRLRLDVTNRTLKPDEEITICREFTVHGEKQSIRQFLDAEDFALLDDFENNLEFIKDRITETNPHISGVDDMPYLIAIGRDLMVDLDKEYEAIVNMYEENQAQIPLKAFFGEMTKRPVRTKTYPLALLNNKVNIDQLLAVHNAVKYPLTYVQGPPGTGKTNTILNTIITAFFNEKSVLFASYNNHPIDSVIDVLTSIPYKDGKTVPFPVIRLGNNEKVGKALDYMKDIYEKTQHEKIYGNTLRKNKGDKIERMKKLTELLKKHEEMLELKEREEVLEKLIDSYHHLTFQTDLQGRQLQQVRARMRELGEVSAEEALALLTDDQEEFLKYLYFTSASYIKRLDEPKYKELLDIIYLENKEERLKIFNKYLSKEENLKKFMRIFPVIATTCISAHKLGEPKSYFDMVIIDEASQCNTALSLVPILRGQHLMLVGDPQQLNPVILLDPKDNQILMRSYNVAKEYDYISNSIYKTYLGCDAVSNEILLSYHYRCHQDIISFNNKKYYNRKLNIKSAVESEQPLVYIDVLGNRTDVKNTAPAEAAKVVEYARQHQDKKIGVITPFARQKEFLKERLKAEGLAHVSCGTVHAFQGDEKDIILFSTALTDQTHIKTYEWLKNNRELINVATSRAKEQLVVLSSTKNLGRLHREDGEDDLYELISYVRSNGVSEITERTAASRALGIKPYSTRTEEAFLENLKHALENILNNNRKCLVHKEVAISQVFKDNIPYHSLFYTGRFDFVVYEQGFEKEQHPILAIELDGKEHIEDEAVAARDREKNAICREHGFELIRIENSYARRYHYMKEILSEYFSKLRAI